MSAPARAWLVCYDIGDPARLQKLHRYLCGEALNVQYSVFLAVWSDAKFGKVWSGISGKIDKRTDDVRAYPLPGRAETVMKGKAFLPDDIGLSKRGLAILSTVCDLARFTQMGEAENTALSCDTTLNSKIAEELQKYVRHSLPRG